MRKLVIAEHNPASAFVHTMRTTEYWYAHPIGGVHHSFKPNSRKRPVARENRLELWGGCEADYRRGLHGPKNANLTRRFFSRIVNRFVGDVFATPGPLPADWFDGPIGGQLGHSNRVA